MHRIVTLSLALGMIAGGQIALAADEYAIDPAHSSVTFAVKHMVITDVKGSFNELEGVIHYDENDISKSSVRVTINAASIDTNNEDRDKHVRSEDFLSVDEYPDITFESKNISKTDDGLLAEGTLTIRGVSREVEIPFELAGPVKDPWGNTRVGITGTLRINRHHYGVEWNKTLEAGGLVVDDDVDIEIQVEAKKVSA